MDDALLRQKILQNKKTQSPASPLTTSPTKSEVQPNVPLDSPKELTYNPNNYSGSQSGYVQPPGPPPVYQPNYPYPSNQSNSGYPYPSNSSNSNYPFPSNNSNSGYPYPSNASNSGYHPAPSPPGNPHFRYPSYATGSYYGATAPLEVSIPQDNKSAGSHRSQTSVHSHHGQPTPTPNHATPVSALPPNHPFYYTNQYYLTQTGNFSDMGNLSFEGHNRQTSNESIQPTTQLAPLKVPEVRNDTFLNPKAEFSLTDTYSYPIPVPQLPSPVQHPVPFYPVYNFPHPAMAAMNPIANPMMDMSQMGMPMPMPHLNHQVPMPTQIQTGPLAGMSFEIISETPTEDRSDKVKMERKRKMEGPKSSTIGYKGPVEPVEDYVPKKKLKTFDEATQTYRWHCDWEGCYKSYTSSGHLARHRRAHLASYKYKCPIEGCENQFTRGDAMRSHYRTHAKRIGMEKEEIEVNVRAMVQASLNGQ